MTTDFNLHLVENPILDSSIASLGNITPAFSTWKHSIRDIGGCWTADGLIPLRDTAGKYGMALGPMHDFFANNLAKRIKVTDSGGTAVYEGQITRLELTHRGQVFIRSMANMANYVNVVYSKPGPQLLANGDVEGGAWGDVGTPSTSETSTDWFSKGTTSMHVVTDAGAEGLEIEDAVGISTGRAYDCGVTLNIVSGTWTLSVLDDATGDVIASRVSTGTGKETLFCQVPDTNTIATVDVQLTAANAAEECFADGAFLHLSPVAAETGWQIDTVSVDEFGRIEGLFIVGKFTDTEATNKAAGELEDRAWVETEGQDTGITFVAVAGTESPDQLVVTCQGLQWSLDWRHVLLDTADQADNHITNLLDESQLYTSANALIETNTAEVLVKSDRPLTLWRAIEKVADARDGSGKKWKAGGYPDFEFRYENRQNNIWYQFSRGVMRFLSGGRIPPLVFQPAWCQMSDMPNIPTPASQEGIKNPRVVWIKEAWFVFDSSQTPNVHLEWTTERPRR